MILRPVRTTQPQGPARTELFAGRSIGNLGLWLPPTTTGLTATANGAPTIQPGLAGQSLNVTGVDVFASSGRGFETGLIRAPSQLTLGLVFRSFDAPVNTVAFGGPFSSDQATINWHHNQADYRGAFTLFVGGAYPKVQFPETAANKLYSVIGTWDGSVMNLFVNGRHIGQAAATGALNGGSAARVRLMTNGSNGGFNGEFYLAHTSDFALPFSKALEVSANPWQIFAPDSKSLWVPETVSAGGGATAVSSDASASYAIRAAIASDAAASYPVRSATSSDTTAAYPLRAATQSDTAAAYAIRSAASADALASYYVFGLVQSDTAGSYAVRAAAQSDAPASYAVRSAVQSDALASYEILSAGVVFSDSPASYAIRSAVQADAAASYPVRSVAQADAAGAYAVRAAVWADAGASYAVQGALVAVWADATANYFVDGVVIDPVVLPPNESAYYQRVAASILAGKVSGPHDALFLRLARRRSNGY